MFRNGLLATTAIVVAGTLSFLAARSAALAQPMNAAAGRDRNREFLCNYGHLNVYDYHESSSFIFDSGWQHVAVPVVGHGQKIDRIEVWVSQSVSTSSSNFSAGIYRNAPSGFPGKLIADGTGRAGANCGRTTIKIAPTMLKRNTTYWIEEQIPAPIKRNGRHSVFWAAAPRAKQMAYTQSHFCASSEGGSCSGGSTSPWTRQSAGPYFKLKFGNGRN